MKKNNIKESLSANALRQLEVLSHYHKIDYENKTVIITIHIKDPSEIIVPYIGDKSHPKLDNSFLEIISNAAHSVPNAFSISINLKVDDYRGYKHKDLMNAIEDGLEIFSFEIKKEKRISNIKMSLLIAAGIIIFSWLYYICSFKLFTEEEVTHNIVHEVIYTVACVLLWEGVYILFLPNNDYNSISYSILFRTKQIALLDKNNRVLIKKDLSEIKSSWIQESKKERRYKHAFLIVFAGYFALSLSAIPEIVIMFREMLKNPIGIPFAVVGTVESVVLLLTAFSTLSFYNDAGKLRKYVLPLNVISLVFIATCLTFNIINGVMYKKVSIFWFIVCSLLVLVSITGIIGAIKLKKKRKFK